jgi:hypothetical protein
MESMLLTLATFQPARLELNVGLDKNRRFMSVTAATFQPPMLPYFVVAVVGFVVQSDTAELMLPLVMGVVRWATALGKSSSSSSNTDDAATCIAHKAGARGSMACPFPYAPGPTGGEWRGVGLHLGRPAKAEMAGRVARKSRRDRKWVG